ncbi:MAG: class I SAM-dependent methyltransferase [Promethearchaeota archaeon]
MPFEKLADKLAKHTRKPTGKIGKVVGEYMGKIHKDVTEWGLDKIEINPSDIILDIGFGAGYNINNIAKHLETGKVYGIDYSETMVDLAKEINRNFIENGLAEIKHGSVSSLPFPDKFFDIVMGVETVNFWPDIINDLREVRRVLKPGGILILINNSYKHKKFKRRNKKWKKLTNFNLYSPKQFKKYLIKVDYSNIEIFEKDDKNWIVIKGTK